MGTAATAGAVVGILTTRLRRTAGGDHLTGLPNRGWWEESLERELRQAERTGRPVSVALIDLDHFKACNDEHGHEAGDRLLKAASAAWSSELRAGDLLARLGGDEFGVLLPDTPEHLALAIVQRLRAATPRSQTASAGVCEWDGSASGQELINEADRALYEAKRSGRDRCILARRRSRPARTSLPV
jgi:diguanylate cyclase (GGDEF)-like protein